MTKPLRCAALVALIVFLAGCIQFSQEGAPPPPENVAITQFDFNVPVSVLEKALSLDIQSHTQSKPKMAPMDWVELLAYSAAANGNDFSKFDDNQLDELAKQLQAGKKTRALAAQYADYDYYLQAFTALLGEYVGEYDAEQLGEGGAPVSMKKYGLKAYSPIAGNYAYSDGDDFHLTRAQGSRGHDLFGEAGTPVAAVESGTVESLGWGRYGGWRMGIRSLDRKRYYEYEHLRKSQPFHTSLKKGDAVQAGDIIGYLGNTGYTTLENAPDQRDRLYFGIRLDLDEAAQRDGSGIWIDPFAITRLLNNNRSAAAPAGTEPADSPGSAGISAKDAREAVQLPIVIYHFVLDKKVAKGEIFISPSGLREDLDFIIKEGFTTVTIADIVAYVYEGAKLPDKPILLSFDDGFYNNIHYAEPLLKERGMRAVLAVVGEFSQASTDTGDVNVRYSYVTWDQIKQAHEAGVFEIQNHSWALHRLAGVQGVRRKKGEPVETYCIRLENDLMKLSDKLEQVTGKRPTAFAYPYGAFSECTPDALLDIGFLATMTSTEGVNTLVRGDPNSLIQMDRYTRKAGEGTSNFFGRILKDME